MQTQLEVTTFSARRYFEESSNGATTPQGTISIKLDIPASGVHYYTGENASLAWIDGLYGDYLGIQAFAKAIELGELPRPLSNDHYRSAKLRVMHSSPEMFARSDLTVLAALNLVDPILSTKDPKQIGVCPKCQNTLKTTPNTAALQANLLTYHRNQDITLAAHATDTQIISWAKDHGLSISELQDGSKKVILDSFTCGADSLLSLSRIMSSLWRIPGVVVVAQANTAEDSAKASSTHSRNGWCPRCHRPGDRLNPEELRHLLSKGIDQQQPLPAQANYQPLDGLSISELLTTPCSKLAATELRPLRHALETVCELGLGELTLGARTSSLSRTNLSLLAVARILISVPVHGEIALLDLPTYALEGELRQTIEQALRLRSQDSSAVILGDPWITPDQLTPTDTAVFKTGKTRQTLAGALGILDKLTQLYASSLDARSHGLTQRAFALTTPRSNPYLCSECGGLGIKLDYALNLPRPLACGCPVCHGRRFKPPVATILFRGVPYYQILNQPITQSLGVLSALSKVKTTLEKVTELGLANLPLAMPVALLSLSERTKLAEIAR